MSGGWNYRVVKKQLSENEVTYDICEVYYDSKGNPHSWAWGKNILSQDSVEDLNLAMERVHVAMSKPILEVVGDDEYLVEITD